MGRTPGQYGGTVRTIIGSAKDIRFMTIYGYARLIGYDERLVFQPDILEGFQSENDTVFTFTLREGHKWSDGSPFTVDDFRYWWEDVLLNKDLTPGGGSMVLRVDGNLPRFEVLDEWTIRYSWDKAKSGLLAKSRRAAAFGSRRAISLSQAVPQGLSGPIQAFRLDAGTAGEEVG